MGIYRDSVGVLLPDALSLGLALLKRVFVFELGAHVDCRSGMYGRVRIGDDQPIMLQSVKFLIVASFTLFRLMSARRTVQPGLR